MLVVDEGEILFLESGDWLAVLARDDHIESDLMAPAERLGRRLALLSE